MSRTSTARVGGVELTNPERVLYRDQGISKRELAKYYEAVAPWMLPHLVDRPLTLIRCPRGREGECFVQRRATDHFPPSVRRVEVEEEKGTATYLAVDSLPGLIALVQLGVLELHTWGSRRDRLDRPDRLILDLDPDPALPWQRVVDAAHEVRTELDAVGLKGFVKTTGGKGLHVVVPLMRRHPWDDVREFARELAERIAFRSPNRYTARAAKEERGGRVFIDYLRNAWSASAVAAYSTRARPGAPVSVPLAWSELDPSVGPERFTVETVPARLTTLTDEPWTGYHELRQRITAGIREALTSSH